MTLRAVVKSQPAKITFVLNKPDRHTAVHLRFVQPNPMLDVPAHVNAMRADDVQTKFLPVDERIKRQDDSRVVTELPKRFCQTRHHIAETADFSERRAFRRN